MGVTSSQDVTGSVSADLTPDDPDWILSHAMASQLAIPEVERLWLRYTQLGYGSEGQGGDLEHDVFSDLFVRNIMKAMKDDSGEVTFLSFLLNIKWLETASEDEKLRAIFKLLNNGRPLDSEAMLKLLRVVYPDNKEAEIKKTSQLVMKQLGKNNKGSIGEAQFIDWTHYLPSEHISSALTFNILPSHINQDAHSRLSEFRGLTGASHASHEPPASQLTDDTLQKVATAIARRDWQLVMNNLGFLQADIATFQQKNTMHKIMAMLKEWRTREGQLADIATLNTALTDSGIQSAM